MTLKNTNLETTTPSLENKSMLDTETNGKDPDQIRMADQIVIQPLKKGENGGSIELKSQPHMGFIINPEAFHVRGLTTEMLIDKSLISGYELAQKMYSFFKGCENRDFYAQNAGYDERAMIHTIVAYAFADPYIHKYNRNTLNDVMNVAKAFIGLNNLNMYDNKRKLYSLSQENLSKHILKPEDLQNISEYSRHDARADVAEGNLILTNMLSNKRINNYIQTFKNPHTKSQLLRHPIFFEYGWHFRSGISEKLCMLFPDHPKFGCNWMNKIHIDPDHLFQEDINSTIDLIKNNAEFKSFKTTTLNFVFPNGSKTFEENFPGCPESYLSNIHRALKEDKEFKYKIKSYWEKQKSPEKKFPDVYDFKHDGPFNRHDQNISRLFHEATDPKIKDKYADMFESLILKNNAKRVMLYHFKDFMDPKERDSIFDYEVNELNKIEASRTTFQECDDSFHKLFADSALSSKDKRNLEEYQKYIKTIKANPYLLLGD